LIQASLASFFFISKSRYIYIYIYIYIWIDKVPEVLSTMEKRPYKWFRRQTNIVWKGTKLWLRMKCTSADNPIYATPCYCKKLCLRLLDQWLKWIEKSFSALLIQVHSRNTASSNNLLPLKVALENSILLLIILFMPH